MRGGEMIPTILYESLNPNPHPFLRRKTTMDPPPSDLSALVAAEQDCRASQIGEDLLQCILAKLPAQSFSYAACVSRSWNSICGRILSRPKLASALSVNPCLPEAVDEIIDKVLSEPIRPDFAILYANHCCNLVEARELLFKRMGRRFPVVTCEAAGMIGKDVLTDEVKEVKLNHEKDEYGLIYRLKAGTMLTIGYLPGMKVTLIPLTSDESSGLLIDRFALDIREFANNVSGCSSPDAVIIYGNAQCDMKSVLFTLDNAFSRETIIVGNETSTNITGDLHICAAALVFARDKCKPDGVGEIQFHYALASGMVDFGQTYKAVSVKQRNQEHSTWLTAKVEGTDAILDGNQILGDLAEMDSDLYIGVKKKRRCYMIEAEKVKSATFTEFYPIRGGDDEYLYVYGLGMQTGDLFRFHTRDVDAALASSALVSQTFQKLAGELGSDGSLDAHSIAHPGKGIFGAFIFSCCGRGESFFGKPNVDSSPVMDSFPGVPVSGMFCNGEVGRGPLASTSEDHSDTHSFLHVYSSIYMLMSYKPQR